MATQSFQLKLGRAMEHAQTLDRHIARWIKRHPDLIVSEAKQDAQGWRREWRFRSGIVTDPRWSLLVGDAIHNLRSGLDHLAYALAESYSGSLTVEAAHTSEFPIFKRPMTAKECQDKIGSIDPRAQAIVKSLQPHLARPYQKHPLWLIHELDNVDKHRLVNALLVGSSGAEVFGMVDLTHANLILNGGTSADPNAPIIVMEGDDSFDPNMEMGFEPIVEVAFGNGPTEGSPVVHTIKRLHSYIERDIVGPLMEFL